MKARFLLAGCVSAAILTAALIAADDAKKDAKDEIKLEGVKCVVNAKGDVKEKSFVEYKGAKVFFCCDNCPKKFSESPEKFSTSANYQLVATHQFKQKKCPLSGQDIKEGTELDVSGVEVAFCCNNCKGKVEKADGKKQIELVFSDEAFDKAFKIKKDKEDKEKKN